MPSPTLSLQAIAWTGTITALFGASAAVAQFDIKRVLAYSTVSQLGYMMLGLATGGVSVGIFHLIAHAFFKALLFLGAGSIIHGCHHQQDIRRMGGLRRRMPATFVAYMVGMLALCGFPLVFSGFWSKDAILHAASNWSVSRVPFYMATLAALLTAFYMTRQVCYVFAGKYRGEVTDSHAPHESPAAMTIPLVLLAAVTVVLGLFGTPMWPWFQSFLDGTSASVGFASMHEDGLLRIMAISSAIVLAGLALGWLVYRRHRDLDPIDQRSPVAFNALHSGFHVDSLYAATIVRAQATFATACMWMDKRLWGGAVAIVRLFVQMLVHINAATDASAINGGFDAGCATTSASGRTLALLQGGSLQRYVRIMAVALLAAVLLLLWSVR